MLGRDGEEEGYSWEKRKLKKSSVAKDLEADVLQFDSEKKRQKTKLDTRAKTVRLALLRPTPSPIPSSIRSIPSSIRPYRS